MLAQPESTTKKEKLDKMRRLDRRQGSSEAIGQIEVDSIPSKLQAVELIGAIAQAEELTNRASLQGLTHRPSKEPAGAPT
ncbi:uncharacterized protein A4U43_C08F23490 [Asparagus officinalis]|nr:uncharacterized protein A4U43_C08F23490 [Asparagus officinalis]